MMQHRVVSDFRKIFIITLITGIFGGEGRTQQAQSTPTVPGHSLAKRVVTTSPMRSRSLATSRPLQRVTTRPLTLARRPQTTSPAERLRQGQLQREQMQKRSYPPMTTETLRRFVTPTYAPESLDRVVSLVHSSNRRSTVETCRCPAHPLGSIDREARAVSAIAETGQPCIIVDGGGYLRVPAHARNKLGAAVALEALAKMGVHAVNVGTTDLAAGIDFFKDLQTSYSVPFISANVFGLDGKPIFDRCRLVPVKLSDGTPVTVAVVGVARPPASSDVGLTQALEQLRVEDPKPHLEKLIPELRKKADIVILLAFYTREEAPTLGKSLGPQASPDIVVCGEFTVGKQKDYYLANAHEIDGVWYVTGGFEGRQLGHAMIEIDHKRRMKSLAPKLIEIEQTIPADPAFTPLIEKFQKGQTELFLRGG